MSVLFHHVSLNLLCPCTYLSSCRPVVFNQRGSAGVEMLVSLVRVFITYAYYSTYVFYVHPHITHTYMHKYIS